MIAAESNIEDVGAQECEKQTQNQEFTIVKKNKSQTSAATATWFAPFTAGHIPSPRVGATLTYASEKESCIMFGGASHEDGFTNDLFAFNLCE
jgi:hypothetical protein